MNPARTGILLSPDGPAAGGAPSGASTDQAGSTGGADGSGSPPGGSSGAAPAPAPSATTTTTTTPAASATPADPLQQALDKAHTTTDAGDDAGATAQDDAGATGGDDAATAPEFEGIDDAELDTLIASLAAAQGGALGTPASPTTTTATPAPAATAPAGSASLAAPATAPKAADAPAAPQAAATPFKLSEQAAAHIEAVRKKLGNEDADELIKPIHEFYGQALHEQAQTAAALRARLDKLENDAKATSEKASQDAAARERYEKVEVPVHRAIDAIPGLDTAKFGTLDKMDKAQYARRQALETLARALYQQRKLTNPDLKDDQAVPQAWEAAHRRLARTAASPADPANPSNQNGANPRTAPTTEAAVVDKLRRQHKSRSPSAAAGGGRRQPEQVYSDTDTGPQAIDKVIRARVG